MFFYQLWSEMLTAKMSFTEIGIILEFNLSHSWLSFYAF